MLLSKRILRPIIRTTYQLLVRRSELQVIVNDPFCVDLVQYTKFVTNILNSRKGHRIASRNNLKSTERSPEHHAP